jgi:hypothetical protein
MCDLLISDHLKIRYVSGFEVDGPTFLKLVSISVGEMKTEIKDKRICVDEIELEHADFDIAYLNGKMPFLSFSKSDLKRVEYYADNLSSVEVGIHFSSYQEWFDTRLFNLSEISMDEPWSYQNTQELTRITIHQKFASHVKLNPILFSKTHRLNLWSWLDEADIKVLQSLPNITHIEARGLYETRADISLPHVTHLTLYRNIDPTAVEKISFIFPSLVRLTCVDIPYESLIELIKNGLKKLVLKWAPKPNTISDLVLFLQTHKSSFVLKYEDRYIIGKDTLSLKRIVN